MRIADLSPGWDVLANDGHRVGRIREVGQHYLEVDTGPFSDALYVPSSAIGNVANDRVHLNVAGAEVDAMGWKQPPRSADELRAENQRDADREI